MSTPVERRNVRGTFTIQTGTRGVMALVPMRASLIELPADCYHEGSLVPLPEPEATPGRGPSILSFAAACFERARTEPRQKSLVIAHSAASGPEAADLALSVGRAAVVLAYLRGDRDAFAMLVNTRHVVEDYQVVLRWVARVWGWPTTVAISGAHDGPTDGAVRRFQWWAGHETSREIAVDGSFGAETWSAIYDVYDRALIDLLQIDDATLREMRASMKWVTPSSAGCASHFPSALLRPDSYESRTGRRAEVFFFDESDAPRMECHPSPHVCLKDKCELHNVRAFRVAHLPVPPRVLPPIYLRLAITEVRGLYDPAHDDRTDARTQEPWGAGYRPGYKSDDDRGRIYVNTIPRTDPGASWQGFWRKDTQYVELTVQVTAEGGTVPHGLRVEWAWDDPDDPTDARMHAQAARETDPNDAGGTIPLPHPDDNVGLRDWPVRDAGPGAAFEQIPGYGKISGATDRECHTAVVDGRSRVRLHVTNAAGDNFRVSARVMDHPSATDVLGDSTGVMTVWKRIDLEYREMVGAVHLPMDRVAACFARCFVQLDVQVGAPLPGAEFLDYWPPAYVLDRKVFTHRGQPGWFFLGVCRRLSSLDARADADQAKKRDGKLPPAYAGPGRLEPYTDKRGKEREVVVVEAVVTDDIRSLYLSDAPGSPDVYLNVEAKLLNVPAKGKTSLLVHPNDVNPEFPIVGVDGSFRKIKERRRLLHPRHEVVAPSDAAAPGGLGFAQEVNVVMYRHLELEVGGISPEVVVSSESYFAGMTIVFADHPRYKMHDLLGLPDPDKLAVVALHELGHGFGFPHKCGHFGASEPLSVHCAMNYFNTWMYRPGALELMRFEANRIVDEFCARHASGIRRVELENNPALWKW